MHAMNWRNQGEIDPTRNNAATICNEQRSQMNWRNSQGLLKKIKM